MKTTAILAAVAGLVSVAQAHYTFDALLINGANKGGNYVKKHKNGYMPTKFKNEPAGSIKGTDPDFSCNKGFSSAAQVYAVKAGDEVGLLQAYGAGGMKHPGPTAVYITPVTDAKARPSGQWYKVYQALQCKASGKPTTDSWCSWGENKITFKVPSTIPNGQYVFRVEHIGLHGAHVGESEHFYACGQISVTGNSATSIPGTGIAFPGGYSAGDKAINLSVYGSKLNYPAGPGPAVIKGGQIRGSADASSAATVTV